MSGVEADGSALDTIAQIIQVALTPVFLLSGIATLLNVFSTRPSRVGDRVEGRARRSKTLTRMNGKSCRPSSRICIDDRSRSMRPSSLPRSVELRPVLLSSSCSSARCARRRSPMSCSACLASPSYALFAPSPHSPSRCCWPASAFAHRQRLATENGAGEAPESHQGGGAGDEGTGSAGS
jgi:hypothetical protein